MSNAETRKGRKREAVIHQGDADRGTIACGAKEVIDAYGIKNWRWLPEKVTCKKCIKLYKARYR